jgi:hypothetical protein
MIDALMEGEVPSRPTCTAAEEPHGSATALVGLRDEYQRKEII